MKKSFFLEILRSYTAFIFFYCSILYVFSSLFGLDVLCQIVRIFCLFSLFMFIKIFFPVFLALLPFAIMNGPLFIYCWLNINQSVVEILGIDLVCYSHFILFFLKKLLLLFIPFAYLSRIWYGRDIKGIFFLFLTVNTLFFATFTDVAVIFYQNNTQISEPAKTIQVETGFIAATPHENVPVFEFIAFLRKNCELAIHFSTDLYPKNKVKFLGGVDPRFFKGASIVRAHQQSLLCPKICCINKCGDITTPEGLKELITCLKRTRVVGDINLYSPWRAVVLARLNSLTGYKLPITSTSTVLFNYESRLTNNFLTQILKLNDLRDIISLFPHNNVLVENINIEEQVEKSLVFKKNLPQEVKEHQKYLSINFFEKFLRISGVLTDGEKDVLNKKIETNILNDEYPRSLLGHSCVFHAFDYFGWERNANVVNPNLSEVLVMTRALNAAFLQQVVKKSVVVGDVLNQFPRTDNNQLVIEKELYLTKMEFLRGINNRQFLKKIGFIKSTADNKILPDIVLERILPLILKDKFLGYFEEILGKPIKDNVFLVNPTTCLNFQRFGGNVNHNVNDVDYSLYERLDFSIFNDFYRNRQIDEKFFLQCILCPGYNQKVPLFLGAKLQDVKEIREAALSGFKS